MIRGAIRQLIHLSTGTDLPATHLVPAANGVGYGYIATADGDVFFDYSAVKNLRFDQLKEGMIVEYALDQAPVLAFVGCEDRCRPGLCGGDYRGRRIRLPAASHITIHNQGSRSNMALCKCPRCAGLFDLQVRDFKAWHDEKWPGYSPSQLTQKFALPATRRISATTGVGTAESRWPLALTRDYADK